MVKSPRAKNSVKDSAERIKQELGLYLTGFSEAPANFDDSDRQRELRLLLDLVLGRFYAYRRRFLVTRKPVSSVQLSDT